MCLEATWAERISRWIDEQIQNMHKVSLLLLSFIFFRTFTILNVSLTPAVLQVYLVGHIPPGTFERYQQETQGFHWYQPRYNERFIKVQLAITVSFFFWTLEEGVSES